MSRYPKKLTKDQMKYLLENCHLPNAQLAETLNTTKEIISTYKYRARKAGIDVPRNTPHSKIDQDFKELAQISQ